MASLEQKIAGSAHVVACELDEGLALLDAARNIYFSLNASGAVVWQSIADPCQVSTICERVADHFGVAIDACTPDVLRMIDRLVELKLAVVIESAGA